MRLERREEACGMELWCCVVKWRDTVFPGFGGVHIIYRGAKGVSLAFFFQKMENWIEMCFSGSREPVMMMLYIALLPTALS